MIRRLLCFLRRHGSPRSAEGRVLALVALVLLAFWAAIATEIVLDRRQVMAAARAELVNLTLAFSEHAAKTIQGADQAARFVREELLVNPKLRLAGYMGSNTIIDSDFRQVAVIDRDGWVADSTLPFTRVDLSDREHFRVHAGGSTDRPFVSKPLIGRVSKKASIQVTRGIWRPDGRFDGVIVVSLAPELLTRRYSDVDLGRDGIVSMVGRDGTLRVRSGRIPNDGSLDVSRSPIFAYMKEHEFGATSGTSTIDGIERLYAFRWIPDSDMATIVAKSIADIEAPAHRRAAAYIGAGFVGSGLLLAFGLSAVKRVAEIRQLVCRLRAAKSELRGTLQVKRSIFSSFAHELRTPLNGVVGATELLAHCDRTGCADSMDVLQQSVGSLRQLVQRMIDYGEIESGHARFRSESTVVDDILRGVCLRQTATVAARGIQLFFDSRSDRPAIVVCDPWRLHQALSYLIEAAVDTSPAGTIVVRACTEGARVKIAVNGSGGAMDDPIWTLAASGFDLGSSESVAALRLALPLATMLMARMQGQIAVHRPTPQETRVTLTLPAATAQPETEPS